MAKSKSPPLSLSVIIAFIVILIVTTFVLLFHSQESTDTRSRAAGACLAAGQLCVGPYSITPCCSGLICSTATSNCEVAITPTPIKPTAIPSISILPTTTTCPLGTGCFPTSSSNCASSNGGPLSSCKMVNGTMGSCCRTLTGDASCAERGGVCAPNYVTCGGNGDLYGATCSTGQKCCVTAPERRPTPTKVPCASIGGTCVSGGSSCGYIMYRGSCSGTDYCCGGGFR